jgi:predicted nucleic acid-binding protein
MKRVFVDSNVFMRFFTRDDVGQHQRSVRLFRAAAGGTVVLVVGPPVLFEIAWTLRYAYKLPTNEVLGILSRILGLSGLELTDRAIVVDALRLARDTGQEFADAYIATSLKYHGADAIATFNQKHFEALGAALFSL